MRVASPVVRPSACLVLLIAATVTSLACTRTALAAGRDAFVGTWTVVLMPDENAPGGGKEVKDTLTFKGMQFTSAEFKKRGFESIQYEEDTRAGIAATFKAEGKSKTDQSTAVWSGTSTANTLNGEMSWTKADGSVLRYTFKGERKG